MFDSLILNIYDNLDEYFNLDCLSKYLTLKEIYFNLDNSIIVKTPDCFKIKSIYYLVQYYFKNEAIIDIEDGFKKIYPYEVYKRCELHKEKIILCKTRSSNFEQVYKQMVELNEIFTNNGLLDDALMQELDIIDECISPKYLKKDHRLKKHIKTVMNSYINKVIEKIRTLKNIPQLSEINLRL